LEKGGQAAKLGDTTTELWSKVQSREGGCCQGGMGVVDTVRKRLPGPKVLKVTHRNTPARRSGQRRRSPGCRRGTQHEDSLF